MRTTLNTIYNTIENNLNKITSDMLSINSRISSGRQMSKISDNPVNMVSALSMRSSLAEINNYQDNIGMGDAMIAAAESSLTEIKNLASTCILRANLALNDSQTPATRIYIADEIHVLLEQSVTLANTRFDGKYVFGGARTTGYTDTEPTPFMLGYIDGYRLNGGNFPVLPTNLNGTVGTTDIAVGDLRLNGEDIGFVPLNVGTNNGLNMTGADNLKTAVNAIAWPPGTTAVNASLTTLYAAGAENASGNSTDVNLTLNGITVAYSTSGVTPAADAVTAINQYSDQTGVKAVLGDGTNGGPVNRVVLYNVMAGDESAIDINALTETATMAPPAATSGLVVGPHLAGPGSNTGEISFSSTESFTFTSDNYSDDTALDYIGLGGGSIGMADENGDGILTYGYQLAPDDLEINGIPVGTINSDGISDVNSYSSAAAKAAAINAISEDWVNGNGETIPGTGVTAEIIPVFRQAPLPVTAGTVNPGDLVINGVDIFAAGSETVLDEDTDNVLLSAINAQQAATGVVATRDARGCLALKAVDGRNLHVETSAPGNYLTHLNGADPGPQNNVYSGQIQLLSDRTFMMESTLTSPYPPGGEEPGFTAIGISGGSIMTGESADIANDGKLSVLSVAQRDNYVRYSGDRETDISIKVGAKSTIDIAKNGEDAIMNTEVFKKIMELEDYLRGRNFTSVTGIHAQDNIYTTLESLNDDENPLEEKFYNGDFTITVTDHDIYPPLVHDMKIAVDITTDTPQTIAQKINGIPGLSSSWNDNGQLMINSSDPDRYTFVTNDDNCNALNKFGINFAELQSQGLSQSMADLEEVMSDLSSQISDFGARANRMNIQKEIYANLELANQENLSEKQDTDITKAILDLKSKEVAYQAALAAAAKTMQLSLVDYL